MSNESHILLIANSNILEVNGLRNGLTNAFVNTATVVATLEDIKGDEVTGQTWPVTLDHVTGSDGCYRVVMNSGLTLIDDDRYKLILNVQGDGLDARWDKYISAKVRL